MDKYKNFDDVAWFLLRQENEQLKKENEDLKKKINTMSNYDDFEPLGCHGLSDW